MALFEQLLAIFRNTFFESVRQPIMLVLLVVATVALILCNPLSTFTMADDQRMLMDLGLATIFTCGVLLAALVATSVLTREIENRTALTVVSKPVGRPIFVLGKFLGVSAAIGLGTLYMSFVYMLIEQHTVLQTVRDPIHMPVVTFGVGAAIIGIGVGVWCNYFYNRVFASTVIITLTPLAGLAYLMSMMFTPTWDRQPFAAAFDGQQWLGIFGVFAAILVLTAIAIAASTRLSQVMTLAVTIAMFVLGLLSNWMFGQRMEALRALWLGRAREQGLTTTEAIPRRIELVSGEIVEDETAELTREVMTEGSVFSMAEGLEVVQYGLYRVGATIVPNFDTMLHTDALTQYHVIPGDYMVMSSVYAGLHIVVALSIAVFLFQRREVG